MKPQKIFPFLLAVGLFLLVLGLLLLFRYAQARGSMMVLAFVYWNISKKWGMIAMRATTFLKSFM